MKESGAAPQSIKPKDTAENLDALNTQIQGLMSEVSKLRDERNAFEQNLRLIEKSLSWRITAPLRLLGAIKRIIWPLWSSEKIKCTLRPGRSLLAHGNTFTVTGPSGILEVDYEGTPSSGWYAVDGSIETDKPHLHLLLYYKVGTSFSDTYRAWVTYVDGKPFPIPFRLPLDVQEFRIDLIDNHGKFTVHSFNLKRLGSIQVVLGLLDRHIQTIRQNPFLIVSKAKRVFEILRHGGIPALRAKFGAQGLRTDYQDWQKRYDTITDQDRTLIKNHISKFEKKPKFSVVMPTYNTPTKWLTKAIESVQKQLYSEWELIIVDDASTEAHVKGIIEKYAESDVRIRAIYRDQNGHITKSTQDGVNAANNEFITFLDHDDEIPEHALYRFALEIIENPEAQFFYSDEDKITEEGLRFNPYFKSDWDPELLRSQNYICHLSVFKTERMKSLGGYRDGTEGAQDWDMILRYTHGLPRNEIRHIPEILYHWRVIATSTAHSTSSKPYVLQSQKKVIEDHLVREGMKGRVEIDRVLSHMKVHYEEPTPLPKVSVIIPTKDQVNVLKLCITGLLHNTDYPNLEIIIVDNGSIEEKTKSYLETLKKQNSNITILRDDRPFNFSRLNNEAAKIASGSMLAFLNNDLEIKDSHWLKEMVTLASRKEVGAVGARLLYPVGLIQHAGVILGIGGVGGHCHKGRKKDDVGYFNRTVLRHEVSAVTAACLVMKKSIFDEISGFDAERFSVAFNDVDLCLRIRAKGYVNIYTPFAELIHYESISRGLENTPSKFQRFESEVAEMKERWKDVLASDPYYNPNLTLLTEDYAFSFPPRVKRKWK